MAITGAAAVSISVDNQDEKATQAAPDTTAAVEPSAANGKFDAQLTGLTSGVDDLADRASRTQQRIDLKQRQQQEQRRKAAEAARKRRKRRARRRSARSSLSPLHSEESANCSARLAPCGRVGILVSTSPCP